MRKLSSLILLLFCLRSARAQENFYRVYPFETPLQGHLELNLWDTYVPKSSLPFKDFHTTAERQGLWANALEAEWGLADHWSLGAYAVTEKADGSQTRFTQGRLETIYRFGERFDHWVNVALYGEYYRPRADLDIPQEAEFRVILDKDLGDFRVIVNPTLTKYTSGEETRKLQFGQSSGIYYRRFYTVQPAIEIYSNFYEHTAELFPAVDLHIGHYITWNIGAGFGLNHNSDAFTLKSIFQYDLPLIKPIHYFRHTYH